MPMGNPFSAVRTHVATLLLSLLGSGAVSARAEAPDRPIKVWVAFKDKGPGGPGTGAFAAPAPLPGSRALRSWEDRPLHEPHVRALEAEGFRCETRLKWQNRVSGWIPASLVPRLQALPFVASVRELPRKAPYARLPRPPWRGTFLAKPAAGSIPDLGAFAALADTLNAVEVIDWMEKAGLKPGAGMRVAVMDADFDLGHAAFARMRSENRIKDQYDFVDKNPQVVTTELSDSHGAQCLSLIGGSLPGKIVGPAPEAEFLLYRTEDSRVESYVEEDYLAAAIERAVDSGAHVISISVVYRTEFDSTPDIPLSDLNGRTRPSSLAALGAARRNVLVVSAMGNLDGSQSGPSTLSVPSDADSILAVGIVNKAGALCGYSTTGPTADNRVKPDLVSMGLVGSCSVEMANTSTAEGLMAASGTSYAAPVIAGIAVLLRQAAPSRSAEEVRQALLTTARNAASPNNQIGWGLPDAWAALGRPQVSVRRAPAIPREAWVGTSLDALGRRQPDAATASGIRFRASAPAL